MCAYREAYLSPKEAAEVLGVGQSSVKRWVDAGRLEAVKSPGGHRRILLSSVYDFATKNGRPMKGMPSQVSLSAEGIKELMYEALRDGQLHKLLGAIQDLRLKGWVFHRIIDHYLYPAFVKLRSECQHPSEECSVLHRALDMAKHSIGQTPKEKASDSFLKVAFADVGYGMDGLPTYLAESIILGNANCLQMGTEVPQSVVKGVFNKFQPDILWLSAISNKNVRALSKSMLDICKEAARHDCKVLIFGSVYNHDLFDNSTFIKNFGELAGFIKAASLT